MTTAVARCGACALATMATLGGPLACTFEALGQGAASQGLTTTGDDPGSSGSTSSSPPTSGTDDPQNTTSGQVDTTLDPPATESGDAATETGEPPPSFPSGPFGPAEPVASVNDPLAEEDDPALSPDGLELYFESTPVGGTGDIFVASRDTLDAAWGEPSRVPGINFDFYNDGAPALTDDGLTMLFISDRPGSFSNDFYVTHRDAPRAPWQAPTRIAALSSNWNDVGPRPVPGGMGIFFCSDRLARGAVGALDLWFVEQADFVDGVYGDPTIVGPLSTPDEECMLMMGGNGLEVFFDTDRLPSVGLHDLWTATRDFADGDLGAPFPLENINSGTEERDPFLSPDGHELYFSTSRDGSPDIFVARR